MSDSVTVRDANEADLPVIEAIYAEHVLVGTASFELEPPDVTELGLRRLAVLPEKYRSMLTGRRGRALYGSRLSPIGGGDRRQRQLGLDALA